jgi:hypothetical protein
VRNKWTCGWDGNWFYCKVLSEQVADVREKGNYPLRSMMIPLNYLTDAPFDCGLGDVNVVAFTKATSIIGGHDAIEEFLVCSIWLLSEKCEFEVETKETPLSMVMVPMLKVTLTISSYKSEAAFKTRIINTANLLFGNYNVTKHNAYTGLRHGRFNHVF